MINILLNNCYFITYLNVSGECGGEYWNGDNQQQMVHGGKNVWFLSACPAIRGFGTNDSVQMPTTILYDRRHHHPPSSSNPLWMTQNWGRRHAVAKAIRKDSTSHDNNIILPIFLCYYLLIILLSYKIVEPHLRCDILFFFIYLIHPYTYIPTHIYFYWI